MPNDVRVMWFISWLTNLCGRPLEDYEIAALVRKISKLNDEANVAKTFDNAIRNGQKIEAIKALRIMSGAGLKEAKDAVEVLLGEKQAVPKF